MGNCNNEFERNYKEHSVTYDKQRFEGKDKKYLEFVRADAFWTLMPDNKKLQVLDVGCGTGRGTILIGEQGFHVTGIDLTREMLDIAEQKKQELGLTNVLFEQGSAAELPFGDNTFDCVTAFNFIHMFRIKSQKAMIDEMTRVLKPGGTLIIEFDSFYKAFIMGAVVQKYKSRTHFNKPCDLSYLFDKKVLKIDKVYGAVIPFVWRFFMHIPQIAINFERFCSRYYPFKYLTERFYVKAVKCD